MGFSDVAHWLSLCAPPAGSLAECETHAAEHIQQMSPYLDRLFRVLVQAQYGGARVVVPLYYNPYDAKIGSEPKEGCEVTEKTGDVIVGALNNELRRRASAANLETANTDPLFDGHGAGSAEPFVFGESCSAGEAIGLLFDVVPGLPADVDAAQAHAQKILGIKYDPHPRQEGAEAIASVVVDGFQ